MPLPYTTEYYQAHREGARSSARAVIPLILQWVRPRSVVDVGCGQGTWLSVFREHGANDVCGVDGSYVDCARLEISSSDFVPHDLTQPLHLQKQYDLAASLEVAEHLPAECSQPFVDSLVRLAPVVLFSAAAPYQGGAQHVNEQWPEYWAERFAAHNYLPVDCLRRSLWNLPDVEWWYAQNLFLYVRRDALESHPALLAEHTACPRALPLVHPQRYLEWIEWGLAQSSGGAA
jgi:SAM-dependent methyltransferase